MLCFSSIVAVAVATAGHAVADTVHLSASGATFPQPLYQAWFADYNKAHSDVEASYTGGGSGAGVKAFTDGTVDFAGSDVAMTDEEITKAKDDVLMLPMTAGSIVLAYNLPAVPDLKLSRKAYIGIFSGTITKWNDPVIAKDNPDAKLPDKTITVAVRSDKSGTNAVFTKHLGAIDADFKANVLKGKDGAKEVTWPFATTGGKGNDGVTALITGTEGTIGYVEYGYAKQKSLTTASLENKSGAFVKASPESGASTLAGIQLPDNMRAFVSDPTGAGDYPITTFTWILVHKTYTDAAKSKAIKDLLTYCLTEGQKKSDSLGYIPLPDAVATKVKAAVDSIK